MNDDETPPIARLTEAECWAFLHRSGRGILATAADAHADIFPVNYLVDGRTLLFRTATGTKLDEVEAAPNVAFEIDGHDGDGYWSVVIRGTAELLSDEVDIIGSGALELVTWTHGEKRNFVRITPTSVQGRRVPRADFGKASLFG
ncbi:MAG: pyridoxamine 5'-phosphate oxidase family protein [Pseudolysinimonas sp.]